MCTITKNGGENNCESERGNLYAHGNTSSSVIAYPSINNLICASSFSTDFFAIMSKAHSDYRLCHLCYIRYLYTYKKIGLMWNLRLTDHKIVFRLLSENC